MTRKQRYESYREAPDLGLVKQYLRAFRRYIEDESNTEHTKEMDDLWKKMGTEAKHFLFNLQLGCPFHYLPKRAIKEGQMGERTFHCPFNQSTP